MSGLSDASPVGMATATATVITAPTGTITIQESVSTSKIGGGPRGSTHGAIEGMGKLVVDAVEEGVIEIGIDIASLKALAMHHTLKRNDGMRCRVSWGAFEKVTKKCVPNTTLTGVRYRLKQCFVEKKLGESENLSIVTQHRQCMASKDTYLRRFFAEPHSTNQFLVLKDWSWRIP
jgi:hypothetical protein